MAFYFYVLLLWTGLTHLRNRPVRKQFQDKIPNWFRFDWIGIYNSIIWWSCCWIECRSTSNTFPLMAGQWIPEGLYYMEPWYTNIFENMMTIQFNHRYVAMTTGCLVICFFSWNRNIDIGKSGTVARYAMLLWC